MGRRIKNRAKGKPPRRWGSRITVRHADGRVETVGAHHFYGTRKGERKRPKKRRPRRAKYDAYLRSAAWQKRREAVLKRDGNACRRCGEGKHLHVHHLTYERICNERLTDLITLCEDCHEAHHRGTIVVTPQLLETPVGVSE